MKNTDTTATSWKPYVLFLLLMYVLLYIAPLGVRPVIIPDEARYAEIPREMISSGNWVSPHLNGLRYFEKPVLGYWATAVSFRLFGENNFAMRLPSALSAGLSACLVFLLLRRFSSDKSTARTGAMVYLTMLGVFLMGTLNILDSLFSFLLTAAFASFYFAHKETDAGKRLKWLISLGVFCGAAFLSKGFLAFLLPVIVIVPFVVWEGRWRDLLVHGWIPIVVALAVIAPWGIMIHLREPDYWHYFFWEEHIKRFASDNAQHSEPFWFYLMYLPLLTAPWIFLLPSAMQGIRRLNEDMSFRRYVWLWLLVPFLFFSLSRGKLPTYILPCMPPLAILIALGIHQQASGRIRFYRAGAIFGVPFIALLVLAIFLLQAGVIGKVVWHDDEAWKWIIAVTALGFAAVMLWLSARTTRVQQKLLIFGGSLFVFMISLSYVMPARTIGTKMPGEFLLKNADAVTPDTILISDDIMIHSVNWFYKRNDVYMTRTGELTYGLSFKDAEGVLLEGSKLETFITRNSGKKPMAIIYHARSDKVMTGLIPEEAEQYRSGKFIMWSIPVANIEE